MPLSTDAQKLFDALGKEKLICLLAPSFPVDFEFPEILTDLKKIGFKKTVELTYAAKLINNDYHELIKKDPSKQWICTNCPTIVSLVKNKYPQHKDKLIHIASPMVIMSRFVKKEYGPEYKTVFVGPCLAKKLEAKASGDVDYAVTFKELQEIFNYFKDQKIPYQEVVWDTHNRLPDFDKFYNDYTKVYPLTGAVAQTMHYKDVLRDDQVLIVDEIKNIDEAIKKFENNPDIKFFDPLACPGGCVGGPGVISKEPIETRIQKVKDYKAHSHHKISNPNVGKFKNAGDLDMCSRTVD